MPFIGLTIFALVGSPVGLNPNAFYLFLIFIGVIIALILRIFPMAVSVLSGLTLSVITGILPLKKALTGYSDTTTWLVVFAFLIAGSVIHTGLGRRIALICVSFLGHSVRGLGYAFCAAELVLGPVVPSNTARGGGILAPLVDAISKAVDSGPDKPEKAGRYLHLVGAHANLITAAMFLTGMAANPIIAKTASDIFNIQFDWTTWALGAIIPGLVGLAGLPWIMEKISPPTLQDTAPIQSKIKSELNQLGPWTIQERVTAIVLGMLLVLWSTKAIHGLGTTTVALLGLIVLLVSNITSWDQMVKNHKAWDALIWLGGLLTLATGLKELGFIDWVGQQIAEGFVGFSPIIMWLILAMVYFYSMYFFSMLTAHIVAFSGTIFLVGQGADIPPILLVGIIAYFSNLCGCLTNYSTGPIIIYFGNGYVKPKAWFQIGFIVSVYHLVIWLGVGSLWWKVIGWW